MKTAKLLSILSETNSIVTVYDAIFYGAIVLTIGAIVVMYKIMTGEKDPKEPQHTDYEKWQKVINNEFQELQKDTQTNRISNEIREARKVLNNGKLKTVNNSTGKKLLGNAIKIDSLINPRFKKTREQIAAEEELIAQLKRDGLLE